MKLSVLMLHALYRDRAERDALSPEERPYAIGVADLARTLDLIEAGGGWLGRGEPPADVKARVLVTFDDGHASAHAHAFPLLAERGVEGIFFVTCQFIERRGDYCDWTALEEMAAGGMRVQSHGLSHRFLDGLPAEMLATELGDSRAIIEDRTAQPVDSIAFPGGRYGARELAAAREAGYRHCFGSRFGRQRLGAAGLPFELRRIAVRAGSRPEESAALALGAPWPLVRRHALEAVKAGVRRTLGNRTYHALYRRWAGR